MSELPYHCPTLNGNFFRPPCEHQIAEAKEKRAKFPNAMLGFLEKCLECGGKVLVKREVGRRAAKAKEQKTPAVARDLGVAPVQKPVEESEMAGVVSFKNQKEAERILGPDKIPATVGAPETPTCTRPDCEAPGSPVKIDKLGRSMGMCEKCLAARGRKVGIENHKGGRAFPPVSIPLNQTKYAGIMEWLMAQADENERTLQAQIMYVLKVSMRGAQ